MLAIDVSYNLYCDKEQPTGSAEVSVRLHSSEIGPPNTVAEYTRARRGGHLLAERDETSKRFRGEKVLPQRQRWVEEMG
jgi:hypothetical protein